MLYKSQKFYEKMQQNVISEEDYSIIFQEYYSNYNYDPEQMVKSSFFAKYFFFMNFFYKEIFFSQMQLDVVKFAKNFGLYSLNVRRIPHIVRKYEKQINISLEDIYNHINKKNNR